MQGRNRRDGLDKIRRRFWCTLSVLGSACCFYYGVLLIAARRTGNAPPLAAVSGAVLTLVPAHDEESTIARCVHSLTEATSDVVVIADHCSDGTADAARAAGARVLEYTGRQSSTKAAAIAYAISELANHPPGSRRCRRRRLRGYLQLRCSSTGQPAPSPCLPSGQSRQESRRVGHRRTPLRVVRHHPSCASEGKNGTRPFSRNLRHRIRTKPRDRSLCPLV